MSVLNDGRLNGRGNRGGGGEGGGGAEQLPAIHLHGFLLFFRAHACDGYDCRRFERLGPPRGRAEPGWEANVLKDNLDGRNAGVCAPAHTRLERKPGRIARRRWERAASSLRQNTVATPTMPMVRSRVFAPLSRQAFPTQLWLSAA